jgi:hypothetical protein
MSHRFRTLLILTLLAFTTSLLAAPAPHDLKVELKAVNTAGVGINYPGPVKFQLKVTNLGPVKVTGTYKILVNKFDHTGQRWIKSVYTRDLPLLDAPGGNLTYIILQVEDTAGDPRTDAGTTFIYRASIGPGYYTDPNNVNNRSDVGVRFLKTASTSALTWTEPLLHAAATPAGSSLRESDVAEAR